MRPDARRKLGALAALALGLFVGLTLLPVAITGPLGRWLGNALWHVLGAGAIGCTPITVRSWNSSRSDAPA